MCLASKNNGAQNLFKIFIVEAFTVVYKHLQQKPKPKITWRNLTFFDEQLKNKLKELKSNFDLRFLCLIEIDYAVKLFANQGVFYNYFHKIFFNEAFKVLLYSIFIFFYFENFTVLV